MNEQVTNFDHTKLSHSKHLWVCNMEYLEINNITFKAKIANNVEQNILNPIVLHLYLLCESLNRMNDYISTGLQVNMHSVNVSI